MTDFLSHQSPTLSLKIAQTIGITSSLILVGTGTNLSISAVPAIMLAPAPLAVKQWFLIFSRGGQIARPLSILSGLSTAYVAWHQNPSSPRFKLNVLATLLVPSIIPFTLAFIRPINEKLIKKKEELASAGLDYKEPKVGVEGGETVHALLDQWAAINLVRGAILAVGSLCAVSSAVYRWEGKSLV